MNDRKRKSTLMLLGLFVLIVVMIGSLMIMIRSETAEQMHKTPPIELSAWVVDWQLESGHEDLEQVWEHVQSVQHFAAYYDSNDRLYFTHEPEERREAIPFYLTVVNDVWHADGTATQKDSTLVQRIMQSAQSRRDHIDQLLEAVSHAAFAGLELDYERVPDEAWDGYVSFIETLYDELTTQHRSLRVVLEPRVPFDQIAFPEGPQYVVMAYNLHGPHSGPGPKADIAFLQQLASRMSELPGEVTVALSTGGFDWHEDGSVSSVTERQAELIATEHLVERARDEASGALYYDYVDDEGSSHTVWYADGRTLSEWVRTLEAAGYYKMAIWRLGELGEHTLQSFFSNPTDR